MTLRALKINALLLIVFSIVTLNSYSQNSFTTPTLTTVTGPSSTYANDEGGTTSFSGATNRKLYSIVNGGTTFRKAPVAAPMYKINRNNVSAQNTGATFYSEGTRITNGYNLITVQPAGNTGDDVMISIFNNAYINGGEDNMFNNDVTSATYNNVERLDYIFTNGTIVTDNTKQGFIICERNGNDNFKVAIAASKDGSNNITSYYSTVVSVPAGSGYWSNVYANMLSYPFKYDPSDVDFQFPIGTTPGMGQQTVKGILFKFADFGIPNGSTVYGISVAAGDAPATASSWLSISNFQTNTTEGSNDGGMDFTGITGIYNESVTISGTVYRDANGSTDATINGTGTDSVDGAPLYVYLVDPNGKVYDRTIPESNGTYSFTAAGNASLTAMISTTYYQIDETAPTSSFAVGSLWTNTGEQYGTNNSEGSGIESGTPNGQIRVSTTFSANTTNVNFGIEKIPAVNNVARSDVNPGGTLTVVAPTLEGTDGEDGTLGTGTTFKIVTLPNPAQGILYYNSVAVTAGQNITNYNPTLLKIDPVDGNVTVSFTYSYTDNAAKESAPATATLNCGALTISGSVYDDPNAGTVGGTLISSVSGNQLYAYLVNAGNTIVSKSIVSSGAFSFTDASSSTAYTVRLSTTNSNVGSPAPSQNLPSDWTNVGESVAGTLDGTINGSLAVTTVSSNITTVLFGLDQKPTSDDVTRSAQNPGGTTKVQAPTLNGNDPEDGGINTGEKFKIITLPANGTLYYNNVAVTVGQTISNYDPALLTIDPTSTGSDIITFTYASVDAANIEDPTPATATLSVYVYTISGTVYQDANAGTIGGTVIDSIDNSPLYAYLVNTSGNVVERQAIAANGTYTLTQTALNTTYTVRISNAAPVNIGQAAPSTVLPNGWINTDESLGTNNNSGSGSDATDNFQVTVSRTSVGNITAVDFACEQQPESYDVFANGICPNNANRFTCPTLNGLDAEDGIMNAGESFKITSLPTNAILYYQNNSTNVWEAVTLNQTITGYQANRLAIDPNGTTRQDMIVLFTYAAVDLAGVVDPTPATCEINLFTSQIEISGTVYDDANGTSDATINGTAINSINGSQLYAYLVNGSGNIEEIAQVGSGGTGIYTLYSANTGTNYTVQISTTNANIGDPAPSTSLPSNWANTDESYGVNNANGTNSDATDNFSVSVRRSTNGTITGVNFGCDQLPSSDDKTYSGINPGGTTFVSSPALTGTDPEDGSYTSASGRSIKIISITNGSLKNGATNLSAGSTTAYNSVANLQLDPSFEGAGTASFTYVWIDAAGKEDPTSATVTYNFTGISLSGTVYDDANGTTGGIGGTGTGTLDATQLYAYLNIGTGVVLDKVAVNSNGTYSFPSVSGSTAYKVTISTSDVAIGATTPTSANLPTGWVAVGDDPNTGTLDGTADGIVSVTTSSSNYSGIKTGFNKRPETNNASSTNANPGGNTTVQVPTLSGSDLEDGSKGSGSTFKIVNLPSASNGLLYYNGTLVTAGQTITNYDPTKLTLDPTDGYQVATFTVAAVDAGSYEDLSPATITMTFSGRVISGTVYNDPDGSTPSGTGIGAPSGTQLYAYLVNASNVILTKDTVNSDGTYSFINAANGTAYTVVISSTSSNVGATAPAAANLPTEWVAGADNYGTNNNAGTGNETGTANVRIAVTTTTFDVSSVNFGLIQRPTILTSTPGSRCGTGTVSIGATTSNGVVNWFAAATGGSSLGTGTTWTTPSISSTTTYYAEANWNGTLSSSRTAVIATVNAIPTVSITGATSICAGATTTLSPSTGGTWASSNTNIATVTNAGVVTGIAAGTATFTFTNTTTTCVSAPTSSVTVLASPTITGTTPGSRCGTSTITLGATASAGTINWYAASTGGSSLGTGTSYTTPSISTTTTYYVDATNGGCTTASRTAVIATINSNPTVSITGASSICVGATTTLSPSTGGTWASSNNSIATVTNGGVVTGVAVGSATFTYTNSTTSCVSSPTSAVSVSSTPTISTTTPASRCGTGTVTLGATASAGTINWYAASTGGSSLGTGTSFTTPSISSTTTYYVDATNGGCTTASRTAIVATVNSIPTITSTTPRNRCGTGSVILDATASAGSVDWYAASTGGASLLTGNSFTTPSLSSTTTYYVEANNGGCLSASRTAVLATINTIPTAPIIGTITQPTCATATGSVALSGLPASGTWTVTGTPSGTGTGTGTTTTISNLSTGTYTFTVNNGNCTSVSSANAVINSQPTTPTITGSTPGSRCGTGTVTLGATASAGTINWYAASTGGSSLGTGTSYTTASISSTTTYYVDATNGSCTTASRTAVLATINSIPTAPVVGTITQPTCAIATGSVALSGLPASGTWTVTGTPSGTATGTGTTTTITGLATGTYTFTVNNGNCTSASSANAVINSQPTTPTITGTTPGSRCGTGTVTLGATASAGTINWYAASTGGSSLGTGTSYTTASISSTTTYYVDATNGGCTTASRTAVIATVNAGPTVASTTPGSRCGTGTVVLGATASVGTIDWYAAATGGTSLGSGTSFTTPSISSNTTYYAEANNGGCLSASRTAVLATVNTAPSITGSTPASRCGTGTVSLGATASAGTINWYTASTGGSSLGTGTSFTTPSISSTTTYYVDATNGGCTTSSRTAIIATINTAPTITSTTPGGRCGTGTVVLGATASAGTINWYSASTGGSSLGTGTSFTTPSISTSTTYYVDATNNGCTTASRTSILASVGAAPSITGTTPGNRCGTGTVDLGATASASSVTTVTLYATEDNDIYAGDSRNYGGCETSWIAGSDIDRTILKFDLSSIPAGAMITSASMTLYKTGGNAGAARNIEVRRITNNWTEGNQNCSGANAVSNWNQRITGTNWTTAGGDFAGTVYATTSVGTATSTSYNWNIASLTQEWVNGTYSNFGLLMKYSNEALADNSIFATSEYATSTNRPKITISYYTTPVTLNWYAASTGGSSLGTGSPFTTPSISSSTTYYVDATENGCSSARTSVVATINPEPTITATTPNSRCGTGTVVLGATASAGTINWYAAPTGGTSLGTGTSFTTPSISSTTTYYVDATNGGCTSGSRTAVDATINPNPTISSTTPASRCGTGTLTIEATASAGTISWYSAASGGTLLGTGNTYTTPSISSTTTYYASATDGSCTSVSRTAVIATISPSSTVAVSLAASPSSICEGSSSTLTATNSGGFMTVSGSNGTVYTVSGTDPKSLSSSITLGSGVLTALSKITLSINATHNYVGDLICTLTSPCGTTTVFDPTNSVSGDLVSSGNYVFATSYATVFPGGAATIATGNYNATFSGLNIYPTCTSISGAWTLTISTHSAGNDRVLTLNSWSISIADAALYTSVVTGPASIGSVAYSGTNNNTAAFNVTPPAGSNVYTVTTTDGNGCTATNTATVTVTALPTISSSTPGSRCGTGTVVLGASPSAGIVNWYSAATGGSSLGTGTSWTTPSISATTTYYAEAVNGSCISSSRTAIIATVNTAPSAPVVGSITQPTCATATGSVALSGLPASGTWTVTGSPSGTATGTGTTTTITGLAANTTYTFTVTNASTCTSSASANAVLNAQPSTPTAPVVGTITQPTCATATGSVALSGLPASGSWTVTRAPGGQTNTGSGATTTITGLTANTTYTFTVTNASSCTSSASANAVLNAQPSTPTAPVIGTITQPTCATATGSVALSGLPASGSWTVTRTPGGQTNTGSGATTTITGLTANTTYTFTVTNASTCTSSASANAVLNAQPSTPTAPVVGTITQPTCATATGSVALSGLPASGTWTVTGSPSGTATGTGTTTTITGLAANTTYTFTVTNASSCTSSASANAVLNAQPSTPTAPVVGTITQPTCATATGSVALSGLPASGSWTITGSPSGTATGSGTTTTITGLTANTTYTFTVTNASTCTSSASTNAVLNAQPSTPTAPVVGTITQPTCATATGSVALSGLPASGTWTVTGSPSGTATGTGTTTTITGLAANTTYTFTVTNASSCTSSASANAVLNAQPSTPTAPVIGTITQPTCATATGSVALSGLPASGSWTVTRTPGGQTNTGSGATTTITGLTANTTYTFTVTNASTCTSSASANAVLNAQPSTPTAPVVGTITQPTCATATGSVALSGLPASGTWTVTGSPSGTATGTGTTTTITGLAANTTYTFTVTNASSCTSSASANAVLNAQPSTPTAPVVGTITQPTCATATGSVALSGLPASGSWTITGSPSGTATGSGTTTTITGLTANTTYTFTVTNASTCTSSASANAVLNAQPSTPTAPVVGTITQPTCATATGSVALSGLPASGSWTVTGSPSGTATGSGTTTTITGLTANTTYTFTVTNASTCTSSASANAVLNAQPSTPTAPVVGTITQPTCASATGSVALSGLPASGSWTITGSPSGTATGTGTTTTITGLAANTTYTFTVTNASTCTSSASANAVLNAQPSTPTAPVVGTITQPTCATATGSVALSGLPASGSWTVTGSPSGTATGSGTTTTITGLTANTTYTFTVTNASTCTSSASTNAVLNAQPSTPTAPVVGTITQPTCATATGSVALSGLPASGTWTVTGNPSGTATGSGTTTTMTGLAANTTYTFTVTNASGCTSSASTNAVLNAQPSTPTAPVVGTITQPTCNTATGSVALSGLPASGSWTVTRAPGGQTNTGTGATVTITGLTANTTYTFTVTNASGCTSSASTNAVLNAQPNPPAVPVLASTDPSCSSATGSITVSSPLGSNYRYRIDGGGYQAGTTFSSVVAGSHTIQVRYNPTIAGCTSSANITLASQPSTPTAPVVGTITQPTCATATGSVALSGLPASGSWTITRSPGGQTNTGSGTTTTITGLAANTTYTFTVTNASTCTSSASTNAVINAQPITPSASIVTSPISNVCPSTTVNLTSAVSGSATGIYVYKNASGTEIATPTAVAAGTYTIIDSIVATGCISSPSTIVANVVVCNFTISGTVFNDANGIQNSLIDGTVINSPDATPLYINLVNTTTWLVVGNTAVASNGTYLLNNSNGVQANTNFTLVLSTVQGTNGQAVSTSLPTDWLYTAEGTVGTGDGLVNGSTAANVLQANLTGINFGIEKRPTSDNKYKERTNPGLAVRFQIPALSGNDLEDGVMGTGETFVIKTLPANANIYYNNVLISSTDYVITNFDSTKFEVDPLFSGYGEIVFTYASRDNATMQDLSPATVTIVVAAIWVNGTIFRDPNGLKDNQINGSGLSNINGQQLFAYLVNITTKAVIEQYPVDPTGDFHFTKADFNGQYFCVFSLNNITVGSQAPMNAGLPSNWMRTGNAYGSNNAAGTGFLTGYDTITVKSTNFDIESILFGSQPKPIAHPKIYRERTRFDYNTASGNATYPYVIPLTAAPGTNDTNIVSTTVHPGRLSGIDPDDGRFSGTSGLQSNMKLVIKSLPDPTHSMLRFNNGAKAVILLVSNPTASDPSYQYWDAASGSYILPDYNNGDLDIIFKWDDAESIIFDYAWQDAADAEGESAPYEIYFTSQSPLPVELITFAGEVVNSNTVNLYWETATELNSEYFQVERSYNMNNWENVGGRIKAAGNSNTILLYKTTDNTVSGNKVYYMLKMVDFDGQYKYSDPIVFTIGGKNLTKVYPNPASNFVYFDFDKSIEGKIEISIIDNMGKVVTKEILPQMKPDYTIDISSLSSGVYTIRILHDDGQENFKLIKK